MIIFKKTGISLLVLMISIILSQCTLPQRVNADYYVNIIGPAEGSVFELGDVVRVNPNLIDGQEGIFERINRLQFFANGVSIGSSTLTFESPRGTGEIFEWIPEEPGEYYLQVMASRRGRWAISSPIRICVIEFSLESPELRGAVDSYGGTHGYEGECEIPERSPDASSGRLTFSATSVPTRLNYYFPPELEPDGSMSYGGIGPDGCGDPSLIFIATAGDPNDDIAFVKVDVSFDHRRYIVASSLILNRLGGSSLATKVFGGAYPDTSANDIYPEYLGESFEVIWTAYAIGRSGEVLASDGPNSIPIEACGFEEMVPLDAPFPTEPPPLEPSEENCPPGTYFAPVTNRCIDIQIPSGGEKDGGGSKSCNKSSASCSSQGYSFDENKCECVPIQ